MYHIRMIFGRLTYFRSGADTAPTGDTRQGPLTCPLATFAVATRDDPLNVDSIRLHKDAVIV